ncbi:tRNA lysidine(34) synthetase TilS [Petroclostridium sp. X23]|uniref:tRNA lysidine(34) synthetase TilS n=1 Tax=Petroclostridium sp. X23 TaxID=3045146 RepID=UPI0024AE830B|nr:tRNA lysidine(34) synthetase TilS [Petroclostridium sp. X23]WHH57557.1 tRNA lysidine(34) synthetase TilS [Petroclostridium sp. X23]
MTSIINIIKGTIEKYNMFKPGDGVVVGVSGGPDSVCLLHVLNEIKDEYDIRLYAAHINHRLRGQDAEEDALYVKQLCDMLRIPFFINTEDIKRISKEKGISEEAAGREVRYAFFFELARQKGAQKIAVAHHLNDQAETVLMRFIRGAGLEGLAGIKPHRQDGVVRPLLEISREQVEEYCIQHDLRPRLDETNLEAVYTRNKLRLDLIPRIIKDYNPNFIQTAVQNAKLIAEDHQFIEEYIDGIISEKIRKDKRGVFISINFLTAQHAAIQKRIIRRAIHAFNGNTANIEYRHIEEIVQMLKDSAAQRVTGKAADLPGHIRVEVVYDALYVTDKTKKKEQRDFNYLLQIDEPILIREVNMIAVARVVDTEQLEGIEFNRFTKAFDYNSIKEEIYIRNRLPGDTFMPSGMKGTKKLKDFFIDLKVPKYKRDTVPLVVAGHDIIWVAGYRVSEKFKCASESKKVLIIELQEVK